MAKNAYVDNELLLSVIKQYKKEIRYATKEKRPKPPIPRYAAECILLIAENLAHLPKFNGYSYLEDMKGEGIINCIKYFDNYDPAIGSKPFAYFTQVIYWAFVRKINDEKKQQYIKYKSFQNSKLNHEITFAGEGLGEDAEDIKNSLNNQSDYANISEFIDSFEVKKKTKRAAIKAKRDKLSNFEDNNE